MLGKKKENPKLSHFVYTVYDSVSKKFRGTFYHSTDEEMIRTSLPTILMDYPLRDIEIHRIGLFDEDSGDLVATKHVIIPTDCYTFPHSRLSSVGDDLPTEEIDKVMKEEKVNLHLAAEEAKKADKTSARKTAAADKALKQ